MGLGSTIFLNKKQITKALKNIISLKLKASNCEIQAESKFGEIIVNVIPIYDKPLNLNSQRKEATEEELNKIKRNSLLSTSASYTVNMLKTILNEKTNKNFSEEDLEKLWTKYKSKEFAAEYGLTEGEGKIVYDSTKETILKDLFNEPKTLLYQFNKFYTISRTKEGLEITSNK